MKGNPSEIFSTEEYARFDIQWPEEINKESKDIVSDKKI
tara:strand:- start:466 stop:582 length:117 start_codon:yes stop_codon:yes gene_type:complete